MNRDSFSVEKLPEFDNHRFTAFVHDRASGLRGFIAIHRGNAERPAFGATRLWKYARAVDALRDALRLSRMMSYKAALAGVNYGGGKGVIMADPKMARAHALRAYADRINYLAGRFITGTDVGLYQRDVKTMKTYSPYLVGVKTDPTRWTGRGILYGIQVCLEELFGSAELTTRTFAIQGVGKVGGELVRLLYKKAKKIIVTDVDEPKLREAKKKYPKIELVKPSDIHKQRVDVFCPCALSGAINHATVREIRSAAVAGGANNQLENDGAAERMHGRGILYAPDYVINAGGLISVVDEYEHSEPNAKRLTQRVKTIKDTLRLIFTKSKRKNISPHFVANALAEQRFNGY